MRSLFPRVVEGADELVEIGGSPVALNDSRQTTFAALHRDEFASSLPLLWIYLPAGHEMKIPGSPAEGGDVLRPRFAPAAQVLTGAP